MSAHGSKRRKLSGRTSGDELAFRDAVEMCKKNAGELRLRDAHKALDNDVARQVGCDARGARWPLLVTPDYNHAASAVLKNGPD